MHNHRWRSRAEWLTGLASMVVLAAAATASAAVDFESPVAYGIGTFPTDVIAIDLTGDERAEIVTANAISNDLSVLVNLGDGAFADQVLLAVGAGMPLELAAGDLDGDGDRDVVVSVRGGAGVLAVMMNSDGVLALTTQYGEPRQAFSPTLADLDGDGDLDAAVVHASASGVDVDVLTNRGDGTYVLTATIPAIQAPIVYVADIAATDTDGNGTVDLVVANDCPLGCDERVVTLHNDGRGAFAAPVPLDAPVTSPGAVTATDLDGDGDEDLAFLDCSFEGNSLVILRRTDAGFAASGTFPAAHACHSFTNPMALAFGDVDGNGTRDAVLADRIDDHALVLANIGGLAFTLPQMLPAGTEPMATAVADVDGDGRRDLITADRHVGAGAGTITVLINATPAPPPGDTNFDGIVDSDDLVNVILLWGTAGQGIPGVVADLDGSGLVDSDDLVQVILGWGAP